MELDSTVATRVRDPQAAPIQRTSWFPHWMSTLWKFIRASMMMSALGPRSKMSPTRCMWSTDRSLMTPQMASMKSSASPVSRMDAISVSK